MSRNEIATTSPQTLIEKAIEKGADIQQLKELMDLQERWEKKEARKSFFDALSKFQTMVPVLKKTKTARINSAKGSFSYKYADLGTITQSIKAPLNDCGLSYRWEFEEKESRIKVICLLSHRDGHTETSSMEAGMDNSGAKNDIQQKGSTQTYLQRYTLIGALGLSTAEEDIDGKGHKTSDKSQEEALDQWDKLISETKTQIELTSLYLKNKKVVDSTPEIQKIFKNQESKLKKLVTKKEVALP